MSEREPELGLGLVAHIDAAARRIAIEFPATGEKRLYALGTAVLKRVQFRAGESIRTREGAAFLIESVEEDDGVAIYVGQGRRVREDAISDVTSVSQPQERLMAGQVEPGEVFDLRFRALQARARLRSSDVRGFLGGRIQLIPHQFFILQEVASRQIPRVLLADEVGLGKTIEACLILQRLLAVGKARRALILVPESLIHQWFVELLRRFNLWFSIYDEQRFLALQQSDPAQNPFAASQLVLCSAAFLTGDAARGEAALAAGWDMVIVDEAHHLEWAPGQVSPPYALVAELAARVPGLLLLTATPTQLGLAGHFARLRLLDPDRYSDYDQFRAEAENYETVAAIAEKIIGNKRLTTKEHAALQEIFHRDRERLAQHLAALAAESGRKRTAPDSTDANKPTARENLLKALLDQHGTGRVVFRNTRATMTGFPKRKYCPAPLAEHNLAQLARIAREMQAEETGGDAALRYSFKDDPRMDWLVNFLKEHRRAKALLICKSTRKVTAIEAALQERINLKVGLFHEGLPLVQRDRNAAWFAEPDGAQLLICSEIGSEGRNFQFAHHLILFDLPLNPGLLEQRIGRLDRIGQTQTIRVHVPYVAGSSEEVVAEWYHRGLDAFETPLHGGSEYQEKFKERLIALALSCGGAGLRGEAETAKIDAFMAETIAFREKLSLKMKRGRDRLLELNSFDPAVAARVIARIRAEDEDPFLRNFLIELLDHFGVRIKEHEEGDVFLDPSHAYIEGFPSIPADGMLATFDRARAIVREDIRFVSADHPLPHDAIDLLIESKAGTTAFGSIASPTPNLLLEAVFILETVADSRWHVDQFLAPTPVRVLIDVRDNDLTDARPAAAIAADFEDGTVQRFLERPSFNAALLKRMLDTATARAEERSNRLKHEAGSRANAALGSDLQRLVDLQKINDHVRPQEIALAAEQVRHTAEAIAQARLRLDSLRLIVEHPRAGN